MKSAKEKEKYESILTREETYLRQVFFIVQSAIHPPPDVKQSNQKMLKHLDHARREYQSAISEISKNAVMKVCGEECKGRCCYVGREDESHYYAIAFWLRYYTNSQIPNQEEIYINHPAMPRNICNMVLMQIRDSIEKIHYLIPVIETRRKVKESYWPPEITDESIPCMYLTDRGCTLEPFDRPIICLVYTCNRRRQALDNQAYMDIAENFKRLKKTHQDVLHLLRKEH